MTAPSLPAGSYNIAPELYHSDPCREPSLSSSGIKRLLSGSPAEFAAHSPRLTRWPDLLLEPATRAQEIGSIAHCIVLGRGVRYVIGDPSEHMTQKGAPSQTWASKEAAAWKADQEANGRIVIDRKRSARAETAAQAMKDLIVAEYGDWPLGDSERTLIWQTETAHGMIWCRALLDHLSLRHLLVLDPKFTDLPIDDRSLRNKAASERWDIQQCWYTEGVEALAPDLRGRLTFRFVVGELNPPYQCVFFDMNDQQPQWMEIAKLDIGWAADRFAHCSRSGLWFPRGSRCSMPPPDWLVNESARRQERAPETGEVAF